MTITITPRAPFFLLSNPSARASFLYTPRKYIYTAWYNAHKTHTHTHTHTHTRARAHTQKRLCAYTHMYMNIPLPIYIYIYTPAWVGEAINLVRFMEHLLFLLSGCRHVFTSLHTPWWLRLYLSKSITSDFLEFCIENIMSINTWLLSEMHVSKDINDYAPTHVWTHNHSHTYEIIVVECLSWKEMDTVNPVQILIKAVCISSCANSIEKGVNLIILSPIGGKYLGRLGSQTLV